MIPALIGDLQERVLPLDVTPLEGLASGRTARRYGTSVKAGRKVRRGHECERAVEKGGTLEQREGCTETWNSGARYGGGCSWKE
jgi:hypothetical protein